MSNFAKATSAIMVLAVLLFAMAGVTAIFSRDKYGPSSEHVIDTYTYVLLNEEASFDINGINEIQVKSVSADVILIPSHETELKAVFSGKARLVGIEKPRLSAQKSGDKIIIETIHNDNKPFRLFTFSSYRDLKLNLYLPESYGKDIALTTTSGNIDISAFDILKLSNLTCHTVSGEFLANSIEASDIELRTTSGNIKLDASADTLEITTVSGDITSTTLHTKSTELRSASGDIKIGNYKGDLKFNTVSGSISVEYTVFENDIEGKTISGDVRFKLPHDSEFGIDFTTTSGEIDIRGFSVNAVTQSKNKYSGTVISNENKIEVSTVSGNLSISQASIL